MEAGWAEAPGGSAAEGLVTAAAAMVAETAEMARGGGPSVDSSPSGQSQCARAVPVRAGPSSTLGKAQRGACRQQCREPANNER